MARFPGDTERHAIFGKTGTGKTVFGLWCLSRRSFDKMPWVIIDFKRDPMIAKIPNLIEIGLDKAPKRKGLYVVRPMPEDVDEGDFTDFLYKIWEREKTGVFIDEGYMIKQFDPALRAILTQGRSKRIPVIALSQRPAWVSPFLLSESEIKSIFYLQAPADNKRIKEWVPGVDPSLLPDHQSYWCDTASRDYILLGPCPPEDEILDVFDARRQRKTWF